MKKIYFLVFSLLISVSSYSQLTLTNTANGVVEVSYGATGDWSLYDPGTDPVVLYLWIDATMNSGNVYYQDVWADAPSLIHLTWNGTAHVGTINFNTRVWDGGTTIPVGTTLTDFNMILRNDAGNSQSVDLVAIDYGYVASTLPVEKFKESTASVYSFKNELHINGLEYNENYSLSLFNILGKEVKSVKSNATIIDIAELQPALYFLVLETKNGNTITKKILKM